MVDDLVWCLVNTTWCFFQSIWLPFSSLLPLFCYHLLFGLMRACRQNLFVLRTASWNKLLLQSAQNGKECPSLSEIIQQLGGFWSRRMYTPWPEELGNKHGSITRPRVAISWTEDPSELTAILQCNVSERQAKQAACVSFWCRTAVCMRTPLGRSWPHHHLSQHQRLLESRWALKFQVGAAEVQVAACFRSRVWRQKHLRTDRTKEHSGGVGLYRTCLVGTRAAASWILILFRDLIHPQRQITLLLLLIFGPPGRAWPTRSLVIPVFHVKDMTHAETRAPYSYPRGVVGIFRVCPYVLYKYNN